jgi:hypothetical protein
VSKEKSKQLELDEILEEVYTIANEIMSRLIVLGADLDDIAKRIRDGLKNEDTGVIKTAVQDLDILKMYISRSLIGRALYLENKIAQAGLKNAEILEAKAKKEKKE